VAAPPLVGRRDELAWLEQRLDDALEGRPQLVLLRGDAGVGKSRLLRELQHTAAARGADVCACRCRQNLDLPYLPFANSLLPRLERITQGDPTVESYSAVIGRLLGRGAEPPTSDVDQLDPAREQTLLLVAVAWAIMQLAHTRPLVLAIEDLQWVDQPSLELFTHVAVEIADAALHSPVPLLVVATHRPDTPPLVADELARLRREEICEELELGGLSMLATGELIRELGHPNASRQLAERVHDRTGGHPLLVEHTFQTLQAESGSGGGATALAPRPQRSEIEEAVSARLSGLSKPTQATIEVASFFGRGFSVDEIAAATNAPAIEVAEQLEEAVADGVLVPDHGRYQFLQSLHARVAYNTPGSARRTQVHLDIANALIELPDGPRRELEIARHLMEAGDAADPAVVLDHTRRAGELARGMLAWSEAARCYAAAVVAAERLDESAEVLGELHLQAGVANHHNWDSELSRTHSRRAAECFREAGDQRSVALALLELTKTEISSGSFGNAVDLDPLESALTELGEDEPGLRARILADMSAALWVRGDFERARDLAERGVALGEESGDRFASTRALVSLAMIHWLNLELREALAHLEAALEHARAQADPWQIALPLARIALTRLWLGDIDGAISAGKEATEHADHTGDMAERSLALAALVGAAVIRGEFEEAERLADEAWLTARLSRYGWSIAMFVPTITSGRVVRGNLGSAEEGLERLQDLASGDGGGLYDELVEVTRLYVRVHTGHRDEGAAWLQRAIRARWPASVGAIQRTAVLAEIADITAADVDLEHADAALATAAGQDMVITDGMAFLVPRLRGLVARLQGDTDAAEMHLRDAIAVAQAMGARPELGRSQLELARVLAARDTDESRADARELAGQARAVFRDLQMARFEEQARVLAAGADSPLDMAEREGARVLLFTDVAGSTALTEELGDAAYRDRAERLDTAVRAAISDCSGEAVEGIRLGDGVLAVFSSARRALECAALVHACARANAFSLHVGLHAGDVVHSRTAVHGGAVNIAARVCEQAPPGETLVSETVRALARTSADVAFEDRGLRELKGVRDPVRLFAVITTPPG
jgi:class 3 adenylate cyclase